MPASLARPQHEEADHGSDSYHGRGEEERSDDQLQPMGKAGAGPVGQIEAPERRVGPHLDCEDRGKPRPPECGKLFAVRIEPSTEAQSQKKEEDGQEEEDSGGHEARTPTRGLLRCRP